MIARAGLALTCILGLGLGLSACATQPPPPPLQTPGSSPAVRRPVPDNRDLVLPPPVGADENYFRIEYGPPDFIRDEEDSQLWRYDGDDCSLFVFLYRENDSATANDSTGNDSASSYMLRYAETDPKGAGDGVDTACLSSIKQKQRPNS